MGDEANALSDMLDDGRDECNQCDGSGTVDCPECDGDNENCPKCNGWGLVDCEDCDGTGVAYNG